MEGLAALRREEDAFNEAHARSRATLRDNLAALRIQYDSEVERITQEELRKQKAKQRQIGVLQRWSAATSLVGSKLLEAQLESEGAAAVAPEVAT